MLTFRRRVSSNSQSSLSNSMKTDPKKKSQCVQMFVCLFVRLLAEWAFCRSKYNLRFCPHRKTYSCVFRFADVVGWHVALPALWLPEPPVTVASHVLKLQYSQLLIGWDTQLVGTTRVEGVESVVNLKETNENTILVACFDSNRVILCPAIRIADDDCLSKCQSNGISPDDHLIDSRALVLARCTHLWCTSSSSG